MPTNWPGPMFQPKSWPQPPSCFSELAGLNACYDSIQMMEQILAKVVCDLATNNASFAQCLVEAIAKSGSNVPLIGVTNGTDAQPGQVGEFVEFNVNATYPATVPNTQTLSMGVLQPGDWDVYSFFGTLNATGGVVFQALPQPTGFSSNMYGVNIQLGTPADPNVFGGQVFGEYARALISVPTLIAIQLQTNVTASAASTSTTGYMVVSARRRR